MLKAYTLLHSCIDFLFPPKPEEVALRSLSPEAFFHSSPRSSATEFPFITAIFSYKYPLTRELIWQIKYKKNKHTVKIAGYALYRELIKMIETSNLDQITLVPIPLSKKRRKERGYNQAELLIDEILKLDTEKRFEKNYDLLIRTKHIERQTDKNRNERLANTKNIFEVRGEAIKDRHIIIVDDVTTTGSTLKQAYDVLVQAGYKNLNALTIAH